MTRLALSSITCITCIGLLVAPSLARAASPVGEVNVDCTRVEGWGQDPDDPAAMIAVHLYFDGPAGDPAATGLPLTANLPLQAGCVADQCAHGFRSALPLSRLDGLPHPVHAYGVDGVDPPLELSLSPASYTCPPMPIVAGIKRHITSPDVLTAWQFSIFFDMMKVADIDIASVPEGALVDAAPQLVVAEGTSDPLWLIDQGYRRPIPADRAPAWRFAAASAVPMPAASLMTLPEGTPVTARPVLAQGSGPKVYLLDDLQCAVGDPNPACAQPIEPTTGEGGSEGDDTAGEDTGEADTGASTQGDDTTVTGGPGSTAGTGTDETGAADASTGGAGSSEGSGETPEDGEAGGCGCRSAPHPGGWALLLPLLLLRPRRARRAR